MQIVHSFNKNSLDEVWSYLQMYMGQDLAHIRVFTPGEEEMIPTRHGIAVRVRDLPKLADAVASLQAAVEARTS
jgi:hypothetical protein